jgi:hypothetical protein
MWWSLTAATLQYAASTLLVGWLVGLGWDGMGWVVGWLVIEYLYVTSFAGSVTTICGGISGFSDGVGTNAMLKLSFSILTYPGTSDFVVTDSGNNRIRKLTSAGTKNSIETLQMCLLMSILCIGRFTDNYRWEWTW